MLERMLLSLSARLLASDADVCGVLRRGHRPVTAPRVDRDAMIGLRASGLVSKAFAGDGCIYTLMMRMMVDRKDRLMG